MVTFKSSRFYFLLGLIFFATEGISQREGPPAGQDGGQKSRAIVNDTRIDSVNFFSYSLFDIHSRDTFKLPGLPKYFQQYDPARQRDEDYGTLGNMGSAAYPLVLHPDNSMGFNIGLNQYQLYEKTEDDLRFFHQNTAFSSLYFSGGETQADLRTKALFTKSFVNNVNWVIDYDRISQTGSYQNQTAKQTSLATNIAYRPENERFSLFLAYIINNTTEDINGGVPNLRLLSDPSYRLRQSVPVFIRDAESRLQKSNLLVNAFYELGHDSIPSDFKNNIQFTSSYQSYFFRYTDAEIANNEAYYDNFFIDPRGIRHYQEGFRFRNSLVINSRFRDYYFIKAGLTYDINQIELGSNVQSINDLFLRIDGNINIGKKMTISGNAYYGLFNAANTFGINAKANLSFLKNQGIIFGFRTGRVRPSLMEQQLVLNESAFWNNDFRLPFFQSLTAEYYHKKYKIKAGGRLHTFFNYIYTDERGIPAQTTDIYAVTQLYLGKDIKFRWLFLENYAFLQSQNQYLRNIPHIFTKNTIGYQGYIFKKKMLLKTGVDFRYILSDYNPVYNPVTGQFQLNTETESNPYPLFDFHASFKVSSFTAFFKYENLYGLIADDIEYMVVNYPQFDPRFRFGFRWNLWN